VKRCVLDETRLCINCGDCERCTLDPEKICDNCCKCLEEPDGYRAISLAEWAHMRPGAGEGRRYRVVRSNRPGVKHPSYGIRTRR